MQREGTRTPQAPAAHSDPPRQAAVAVRRARRQRGDANRSTASAPRNAARTCRSSPHSEPGATNTCACASRAAIAAPSSALGGDPRERDRARGRRRTASRPAPPRAARGPRRGGAPPRGDRDAAVGDRPRGRRLRGRADAAARREPRDQLGGPSAAPARSPAIACALENERTTRGLPARRPAARRPRRRARTRPAPRRRPRSRCSGTPRAELPQRAAREQRAGRVGRARHEHARASRAGALEDLGRRRRRRAARVRRPPRPARAAAASPATRRARRRRAPAHAHARAAAPPAPCPTATCSGATPWRSASASRSATADRSGYAFTARRRANVAALTASGCGGSCHVGAGEVERVDPAERAPLARRSAQQLLARSRRAPSPRTGGSSRGSPSRATAGAIEEPGPSSSRNQTVKPAAATIAVTMKIRPSTPSRWSWPGGAAQQPPQVVEPRRDHEREDQRADQPDERDDDAEEDAAGVVVDLRADPHPADGLRPPRAQHDERLDDEHRGGEQRVDASPPGAAALAAAAVADRRRARTAADEQAARVRGVVARHATVYGGTAAGGVSPVATGGLPARYIPAGREVADASRHHPSAAVVDERRPARPARPDRPARAASWPARWRRPSRAASPRAPAARPPRRRARAADARPARADPRRARRPRRRLHATARAALLERMRRAPERHRWAAVTSADLGEPGCTVWQVRPASASSAC